MKKKLSRIACLGLSAALACAAFTVTGCGPNGSQTAITVNGEAMPYGEALFALRTNQAEVYYTMATSFYGSGSAWDEEFTPEGEEEPVLYGTYFKDQVKNDLVKLLLLKQKSSEYGVAIDEADIAQTEELADSFMESNADAVKNMGITRDDCLKILQLNALKPKMKAAMTVDVDTNVTDEEADMSTVTYLRIAYPEEDAETEDTEAAEDTASAEEDAAAADSEETETEPEKTKEELYAEAEEVLKSFKEAGDVDYDALNALGDAVDEDFFGMTYSYAPSEAPFEQPVLDAIATLKDGEVYDGIIDDGTYYYLVRLDKLHDPEKMETKREQIINQRRTDLYNEILDGWVAESQISEEKVWTDTTVTDKEPYVSTQMLETMGTVE